MTTSPEASSPQQPFDPGLQPERTALAWRRTALTALAGALLTMRILPTQLGAWATAAAALLAALAAVILTATHRRYRRQHQTLTDSSTDRPDPLPGGALPCAAAALAALLGILILIAIL